MNAGMANPGNKPQSNPSQLPKQPHKAQAAAAPPAAPGSDAENQQPESSQVCSTVTGHSGSCTILHGVSTLIALMTDNVLAV